MDVGFLLCHVRQILRQGWLAGWLAGWLRGSIGWFLLYEANPFVRAGWLGAMDNWLAGWLAGWLASAISSTCCGQGWLAGGLACSLTGQEVGHMKCEQPSQLSKSCSAIILWGGVFVGKRERWGRSLTTAKHGSSLQFVEWCVFG